MVVFVLCIKGDLDGIGKISINPDANLCLDVKNPLSDYETREKVVLQSSVLIEPPENSREKACHFAIKWEGSKKRSTMVLVDAADKMFKGKKNDGRPRDLDGSVDSGVFVPVAAFECRGVEPTRFRPMEGELVVTSEGGAVFADVDVSEGDFADYDDENDISVSITDFESKFVRF
mmetsp:Transcript_50887/g.99554  ORF Transcript_50887/g.99554 Transcript_50887/m.99554 type:complete len:175 (+) Transcript_50887:88-612(+)